MATQTLTQKPANRWPWRLSIAAGILAAAAAAFLNVVGGAFACAWDTSYCATAPDELQAFQGTITDPGGRPVPDARFQFRDDTLRDGDPGPVFRSGPDGSYCVMWPAGSTRPFAHPIDQGLRASVVEPNTKGALPAEDCQRTKHRAPWYRYQNLTSTWQYWLLLTLSATVAGLFAAAGVTGRRERDRARALAAGAAALLGLNAVLFLVLWSVL